MIYEAVYSCPAARTQREVKTVSPSAQALEGRFPYLKKHPYRLPVAWTSRLFKYWKETRSVSGDDAAESVKIGNQRIEPDEAVWDYRIRPVTPCLNLGG